MDVFIKSFNRPYYLERCIRSIQEYLKGEITITVLDDGTPQRYLDKMRSRIPSIKILKSNLYEEKSSAIAQHLAGQINYNTRTIPSHFWYDMISRGSDIFLLMEEDAWFTKPLDLADALLQMEQQRIFCLKLFWCRNEIFVRGKKIEAGNTLEIFQPELPVTNDVLAAFFLDPKYLVRSVLQKSALLTKQIVLPYYSVYTVSSALFRKDYWLSLWKNAPSEVAEHIQLLQALRWLNEHRGLHIAKTKHEVMTTSYITSSLNSFTSLQFDFITFNASLNEAWLSGALDPCHNMPADFPLAYLNQFVSNDMLAGWARWRHVFQDQFSKFGCVIEQS